MERWREKVQEVMDANQVRDPFQVIGLLLHYLGDLHRFMSLARSSGFYQDGLDNLNGQHATTATESLVFFVNTFHRLHGGNAERWEGSNQSENPHVELARQAKVLDDLLSYCLLVWNATTSDEQQQHRQAIRRRKRETPDFVPLDDPDKDDPESPPRRDE